MLNKSTIEFTDHEPDVYRNTKKADNVDSEGNQLDCTVTKR